MKDEKDASSSWQGVERRQHGRVDANCTLLYSEINPDSRRASPFFPANLEDISLGGIKFSSTHEVAVGKKVNLILRLFDLITNNSDEDPDQVSDFAEFLVTAKILGVDSDKEGEFEYRTKTLAIRHGHLASLYNFIAKFTKP